MSGLPVRVIFVARDGPELDAFIAEVAEGGGLNSHDNEEGLMIRVEEIFKDPSDVPASQKLAGLDSLRGRAKACGVMASDLYDTVNDLFAAEAAGVNHAGLHAQLRFLIDRLGQRGALAAVEEAAGVEL